MTIIFKQSLLDLKISNRQIYINLIINTINLRKKVFILRKI